MEGPRLVLHAQPLPPRHPADQRWTVGGDARAERLLLSVEQFAYRTDGHRAPLEEPVPIARHRQGRALLVSGSLRPTQSGCRGPHADAGRVAVVRIPSDGGNRLPVSVPPAGRAPALLRRAARRRALE